MKEKDYQSTIRRINRILFDLYYDYSFLAESGCMSPEEKAHFYSIFEDMRETTSTIAIHRLSKYLYKYYNKKVIILLDEYDTPMHEAYVNGYWEKLVFFTGVQPDI